VETASVASAVIYARKILVTDSLTVGLALYFRLPHDLFRSHAISLQTTPFGGNVNVKAALGRMGG
jgi:hypothetical protein